MTRFVSVSMALVCAFTFFAMFTFFGCGSTTNNGGGITTGPTPPPADCDKGPTNENILDAVYLRLKAEGVENEWWQFNITADRTQKQVRITGWSSKRPDIIGYVRAAAIHCTVLDDSFAISRSDFDQTPSHGNPTGTPIPPLRVGCPPGYAACGDICIPSSDTCKLAAASPNNKFSCTVSDSKIVMPSPSPNGNVESSNGRVNK